MKTKQLFTLALSAMALVSLTAASWAQSPQPNVVLMLSDNVAYKHIVEDEIAKASVKIINKHAATKEPFFLLVGLTQTHYPNVTSPEFSGKSTIGPYGDALLQHDHAVGEILDAIEKASIEDNTIVIYISDNGSMPLGGPPEYRGASNGMYTGELGDGREGSIRVPGMIRWPNKIPTRKDNGMFSTHDFFPPLANIIGAKVPTDRPIDGIDQTDFILGKQKNSNRESFISFIGNEIVAVRWQQYRFYPKTFMSSPGNPSMAGLAGVRLEGNSMPFIYDIAADPREEDNKVAVMGWTIPHYMQAIGAYMKSLEKYPNPAPVNLTDFKK